jgi:ribosomal protein S18 acetylase RimI-like enzyme
MADDVGDVWRAEIEDLELVVPLFDAYRQFYGLPTNLEPCRAYLRERITRQEAVIFLIGRRRSEAWGFTQLYPTFSSLQACRTWVLYDLFVSPATRHKGLGRRLMNRAREHAVETGASSIALSTARTNLIGQALYESLGYVQDKEFLTYELALPAASGAS